MGVKFGVEEGRVESGLLWTRVVYSITPNFTPIGALCHPCGAKNLKIAL